jgi:hypothetical protein
VCTLSSSPAVWDDIISAIGGRLELGAIILGHLAL